MNIVIFSDYDIAGNLTLLAKLINKYTIHQARCIIVMGDYLNYDSDITLVKDPSNMIADQEAIEEAEEIIKNADFFHIGRQPVNFGNVQFEKLLNKHNCVIQYFGSHLRDNKAIVRKFHEQTEIKGISWVDATMLEDAGVMYYHFPDIFDVSKVKPWWEVSKDIVDSNLFKIVHSPTNRQFKKTDLFLSVIDKLKKEYSIDLILLEGFSNKECLKQKQTAQILFDQISVGRFALSAIESLAMGQAVLCSVSNLVMSCFPDNPVIPVTENTLEIELRNLLENRYNIKEIGKKGINWVKENCDPVKAVKQYIYFYDYVINGNRLIELSENFFKIFKNCQ